VWQTSDKMSVLPINGMESWPYVCGERGGGDGVCVASLHMAAGATKNQLKLAESIQRARASDKGTRAHTYNVGNQSPSQLCNQPSYANRWLACRTFLSRLQMCPIQIARQLADRPSTRPSAAVPEHAWHDTTKLQEPELNQQHQQRDAPKQHSTDYTMTSQEANEQRPPRRCRSDLVTMRRGKPASRRRWRCWQQSYCSKPVRKRRAALRHSQQPACSQRVLAEVQQPTGLR
jgi:hypothetical protein